MSSFSSNREGTSTENGGNVVRVVPPREDAEVSRIVAISRSDRRADDDHMRVVRW